MYRNKHQESLTKLKKCLKPLLENMDYGSIGKYNKAYSRHYSENPFEKFVETEWPYYVKVLDYYLENVPKGSTVLEVGMFIPVIPLLLTWHGFKVTTVEDLRFYGNSLDPFIALVEENGVVFKNYSLIESNSFENRYDAVNLLAVVEHLTGSPKLLLSKIFKLLKDDGDFVFVVPNQARLTKRIGLLFGYSVMPPYEDYFDSEYPFEGHHREYVFSEVNYMMNKSNFYVTKIDTVIYGLKGNLLKNILSAISYFLPKTFGQAIFAVAKKNKK